MIQRFDINNNGLKNKNEEYMKKCSLIYRENNTADTHRFRDRNAEQTEEMKTAFCVDRLTDSTKVYVHQDLRVRHLIGAK